MTAADYPSASPFTDATIAYDAAGNRSSVVSGATTNYTRNNLNQYTAVGAAAYTYVKGNLTNDGAKTYAYDLENQLLSITGTGLTASYTYDPFGRRLSQTVNSTTTRFLYDGADLIQETNSSGTLQAAYAYGPSVDEPLRMVRGATTSYYHQDALGSVIALSNAAGTVTESYKYDAFGTVQTPSSLGNRFLFTGREFDQQTSLYYYRARYYSPSLGRFLSRDPLSYAPDANLYRYVGNNSGNWIDPLGLEPFTMMPTPSAGADLSVDSYTGFLDPMIPILQFPGVSGDQIPNIIPIPMGDSWPEPIPAPMGDAWPMPNSPPPGDSIPSAGPMPDDRPNGGCSHGTGQESPKPYEEARGGHRKNRRPSTQEEHEKGEERRSRDRRGGEKGDRRRWWPPKRFGGGRN